jgi:hypothetical protein
MLGQPAKKGKATGAKGLGVVKVTKWLKISVSFCLACFYRGANSEFTNYVVIRGTGSENRGNRCIGRIGRRARGTGWVFQRH